jgi:hypothetical protein
MEGAWTALPGDAVEIHSLEKRADLNGETGRVLRCDEESQRSHVRVDATGETIALKPANVRPLAAGGQRQGTPSALGSNSSAPSAAAAAAPFASARMASSTATSSRAASSTPAGGTLPRASAPAPAPAASVMPAAQASVVPSVVPAVAASATPAGAALLLQMRRVCVGRVECGSTAVRFTASAIEWLPTEGWFVYTEREQCRPHLALATALITALEIDPAHGSMCVWSTWPAPIGFGISADKYAPGGRPDLETSSVLFELDEPQLCVGWHAKIVRARPLDTALARSTRRSPAREKPSFHTPLRPSPPFCLTLTLTPLLPHPH